MIYLRNVPRRSGKILHGICVVELICSEVEIYDLSVNIIMFVSMDMKFILPTRRCHVSSC